MEKLVYVLWKPPHETGEGFRKLLLGDLAKRVAEAGGTRLTVNVSDDAVAHARSARITRLPAPIDAFLGFWLDCADDRVLVEAVLAAATSRHAGYLVAESVPLANTAHPVAPGERTPGVNMVTCIERPAWIDDGAWFEHWHGHHKRVALETQCTFLYVRNVVVRPLTPEAPPWRGIVEEGFPADAVTDPMRWYKAEGSKERFERNFGRMIESCRAFLDLDRVESHPMSLYAL